MASPGKIASPLYGFVDHPELFDAILTLERPAPEAFAATLHEIETPADRP